MQTEMRTQRIAHLTFTGVIAALWMTATMSTAKPSSQSWTPPKSGGYKRGARCYDRDGTVQPVKTEQNSPSGAVNIAFVTVDAT
ncbi:MAG: hypothetical protein ACR2JW_12300 [Thermomicrobiales bacterium]